MISMCVEGPSGAVWRGLQNGWVFRNNELHPGGTPYTAMSHDNKKQVATMRRITDRLNHQAK